ncbi:hypothetical protein [Glutamicibacter creatinolyticus]
MTSLPTTPNLTPKAQQIKTHALQNAGRTLAAALAEMAARRVDEVAA